MRIAMIHQPHFLPWPGYIARCLAADLVVCLDSVQFNKSHFQHRTRFIDASGAERWLTLPVMHATRSKTIAEVQIAESFNLARWQRSFREAYRKSPEFQLVWEPLTALIRQHLPSLSRVTVATLVQLLASVGPAADRLMPHVSIAGGTEQLSSRTQRLAKICADRRVTHLIMGRDAMACHDCNLLRASGLILMQHVYVGPRARAPRPGVSVLHDVFRLGRAEVTWRLGNDWSLELI